MADTVVRFPRSHDRRAGQAYHRDLDQDDRFWENTHDFINGSSCSTRLAAR